MEDDKSQKPEKEPRKKLVISEKAIRRLVLEDQELEQVVGGGVPGPGTPVGPYGS
jgi:hypothetical protein